MWLTGFDAPSLHTMYLDKPMRGHGLMQAIARVNRVFRDKPGGLVVDYLGIAHELKAALATYTETGGTGRTAIDQDEAVAAMLEKYEICCALFHGFDWSNWISGGHKSGSGFSRLRRSTFWLRKTAKTGACKVCVISLALSPSPFRMRRLCAFATMWRFSKVSRPYYPNAHPVRHGRNQNSITQCARSFHGLSSQMG